MTCEKFDWKILLEKNSTISEFPMSRALRFPDGRTHIITAPRRIWGWYDELFGRRPWRKQEFLVDILQGSLIHHAKNGRTLHQEIEDSFSDILGRINHIEFDQNSRFLTP